MEKEIEKIVKDFYNHKDWEKTSELVDHYVKFIACARICGFLIQIDTIKTEFTPQTFRMWVTSDRGVGLIHYDDEQSAFADMWRIVSHDLDFVFTDGLLTEKIYKYKEE